MSTLSSGAVVGLSSAAEATFNTQPTTTWRTNQPNSDGIKSFFAKLKKVALQPLSPNMQREKGDIVDLDASPQIMHDITKEFLDHFGPGALLTSEAFCGGTGTGRFAVTPTDVGAVALTAVTSTQFTVASGGALQSGTLIVGRGFAASANNGLLVVGSSSASGAIKVASLVADAAPNANAMVEVCGFQGASADIVCTTTGLTSTVADFTTMGLTQYQWIWLGGGTAASPGNFGFATAGCRGWARITAIAAHVLTVDRQTQAWSSDSGTGKTIQIFFGSFLRNVAKTAAARLEQSYSFELSVPGLDTGASTDYFYCNGGIVDKLVIDAPAQNKIVATMDIKGTTITAPTTSRATGPSSSPVPLAEAAYNTTSELFRLRIADATIGGTYNNANCIDIDTWKLTINNNVTAQKQQANLGPLRMLPGEFDVDLDITAYLLQPDLINSIRNNTSLMAEGCLRNNDGGWVWDIPYATFEDGEPSYPQNKPITIKGKLVAYRDPTSNFTLGITRFPYLPAS